MANPKVKLQLETLLQLLQQEREMAKTLDMEGMGKVVSAKEELLAIIQPQVEDVVGLEDLLHQIEYENRRNAFLLWTGLNWVRDLMGFFGTATAPQVYGQVGQSRRLNESGRLLSGKV